MCLPSFHRYHRTQAHIHIHMHKPVPACFVNILAVCQSLFMSVPIGDQLQTMMHQSGFHLSHQYYVLITYYSQAKEISVQVRSHVKKKHGAHRQKHLCF